MVRTCQHVQMVQQPGRWHLGVKGEDMLTLN